MLSEIKAITELNEKVIFHMQSVHGIMNSLVAFVLLQNPLVAQQRGPNMPPSWKFRFPTQSVLFITSCTRFLFF